MGIIYWCDAGMMMINRLRYIAQVLIGLGRTISPRAGHAAPHMTDIEALSAQIQSLRAEIEALREGLRRSK